MRLEPVIGLEIHAQLKTKSKMFCPCERASDLSAPNSSICPVCLGHPGTLPVPNDEAVRLGVKAALALQSKVNVQTKFDRKNYFYPDLPKGYQISQYDQPLSEGGFLVVDVPDNSAPNRQTIRVSFTRLHLEEDAAKLTHAASNESLVDYNRGGAPLAEIVTEPDLRTPEEARVFLQELRRILRELNISDADMEKGQMRCDANISLREVDDSGNPVEMMLRPKTEIKNINSFRSLERALYFEIDRQTTLWEMDTPPSVSSTRGWNDDRGVTELQRTKEAAHDYRYFPEPDIPALDLTEILEEAKLHTSELPAAKRTRFIEEYFVSEADARTLTDDQTLADYFEQVVSETVDWVSSLPGERLDTEDLWIKEGPKLSKMITGWLLNKLSGLMNERSIKWKSLKITPENFAELIKIIYKNETTGANALKILEIMLETHGDPSQIMDEKGLGRLSDPEKIRPFVVDVVKMSAKQVAQFKEGKEAVMQYLIGMVMKSTEGRADPKTTEELMRAELKK
ncbi:MAG: Asp-tRNA(Asn)/Glu-tRNA(Gln) amidotransferase subunit GatB [bacterium]